MNEKEMLSQLEDLIQDRKSLLGKDNDPNNPFQRDINALEKIIYEYKIFRDAAFRSTEEKGETLNIWINENVKLLKAEILNIWKTDFGDVKCNVILYKRNKKVANIIISYEEKNYMNLIKKMYGTTRIKKEFYKVPFKTLTYNNFNNLTKLPKISKCSNLLKEIYDNVRESDASMCHITERDWENFYSETYNEKDFEILKEEIEKYNLREVIEINSGEYKIIAYGDLETKFNDNRNLRQKDDLNR